MHSRIKYYFCIGFNRVGYEIPAFKVKNIKNSSMDSELPLTPRDVALGTPDSSYRQVLSLDMEPPKEEPREYQHYDWDTVMLFPRKEGGEEKHPDRYTCEVRIAFVYNLC